MRRRLLKTFVAALAIAVATPPVWATDGALNGKFSISATEQVYFSQGNLQWSGNNGWRFAEHQYDYIGDNANNNSPTTSDDNYMDLFYWGSSGLVPIAVNPYHSEPSTPNSNPVYTNYISASLDNTNDWGSNAITNGGNTAYSGWRTLSNDEWHYLFESRDNAADKWGFANVGGVSGLVILPDVFTDPMKNNGTNAFVSGNGVNYEANVYTTEGNWEAMEAAGAVFLPAAGHSFNGIYSSGEPSGYYWSSSHSSSGYAYCMYFRTLQYKSENTVPYYYSVRLVRPVPLSYTLGDIPEGWTVTANGQSVEVTDGTATITEGADVELIPANPAKVKDVTLVDTPCETNEYLLGTWNSTTKKVVYTKTTASTTPTAVADATTDVTWSEGWYTVAGNVTINGKVTLGADTHLILQDGAQLTINGLLSCNSKNLYIYGQEKGDGKLNVTSGNDVTFAINGETSAIEIHGGEITVATEDDMSNGFSAYGIKVYGGKLTANAKGVYGIRFKNDNFEVYGGEVEATSTSTSGLGYGIAGLNSSDILIVYGSKVKGTGSTNGKAFNCQVQSGTDAIKFYFADTEEGLATAVGTVYPTATATPNNHYAKAE